jgi:CDP-glycerol glycerophosphotransferase (TagB/SpsB family)
MLNHLKSIYQYFFYLKQIKIAQKKIKINKKNIIFQIGTLYHFEIIKDLFAKLKENKNINLTLGIDDFNIDNIKYLRSYTKNIIPSISIKYLKNVDLFIKTSYEIFGPKGTKQVLIFHGFPVKNTSIKKEYIDNIDYFFTSSSLEKSVYKFISQNHIKENKFKEIGYTKLDKLFNKKYKSSIKQNKNKKNIIYAPSWDQETSLRSYGTDIIKLMAEHNPSKNIFVKPHPALLESPLSNNFKFYTGGIDWKKKIQSLEIKYKNVHLIEDNLVDLIKIGDLLVTDISGAALEFIYFNKSVIFIESKEFYKKVQLDRNMNSSLSKNDIRFNAGRNYGIVVKNLKDLLSKIDKNINKKNNYNFCKKNPYYNEGTAINNAINEINSYIDDSSNKSPS